MKWLLVCVLVGSGCANRPVDVAPPGWEANTEKTAVIGRVRNSTIIITGHGHTRDYRDVLDSLNLGPATVDQFDLYWVTPLAK